MKKTLLLISLLLTGILSAQKYVPFPTDNAEWNINYTTGTYGFPSTSYLKQYSLHGDTIINNITYKKLCINSGTVDNPVYKGIGGLREQDKKIYYYGCNYYGDNSFTSNQEALLYDFNKGIGEDVIVTGYIGYTITKIDSVKIGNSYRKRYNDRIIEGIGDVQQGLLGIITPLLTCWDCNSGWQFICFSQNGESVYKNRDYVDCESTKKWSEVKYLSEGSCWTYAIENRRYQTIINGDTTINGIAYKKVYDRAPAGSSNGYSCPNITTTYMGAIREQDGKFYANRDNSYINKGDQLIYDFTLNTGDTIRTYGWLFPYTQTVNSVETITLLNGEKRVKLNFRSTSWIEGIGGLYRLFYPEGDITTCMSTSSLICYKVNNIQLYNVGCISGNCCDITDALENVDQESSSATLSNNPLTTSTILKWNKTNEYTSLIIADLLGKNINKTTINNLTEYKLTRNQLEKGIYIIQLLAKNGRQESLKLLVE